MSPSQNSVNVTNHARLHVHHSRVPRMICNILYMLNSQSTNDTTVMAKWIRVAFIDEFFDFIEEVHCRQKGYIGSNKTIQEVNILSLQVYARGFLNYLVSTLKISKL